MSQALGSAKSRRVKEIVKPGIPSNTGQQQQPVQNSQSVQSSQPVGLTLPQVISLVDKRLVTLEKFMKETKEQPPSIIEQPSVDIPANLTDILNEFNERHEILANEIGALKNTIIQLQTYTMSVNKMLLEQHQEVNPSTTIVDNSTGSEFFITEYEETQQ